MAKAKRTAKQKAATRKLIAFNRAKARGAKRAAPRKPAARPAAKKRPARSAARSAPKRKSRGKWRVSSQRAASTAGRVLRHRRPNPIGNFVKDTLMPSVIGGAGALALDVAVGFLPLPPAMKTGPMAPLVKAAGAIGLGMLAGQFMGRRMGEQVAAGGLTVTAYNIGRQLLIKASGGRIPGLSEYVGEYMSEYVDYAPPQLGYESSGSQVGEYSEELNGYETGVYR
jgi:hypothetical protein